MTGSREPSPAVLALTGFDPARFERYLRTGEGDNGRMEGVPLPPALDARIDGHLRKNESGPALAREIYANPAASQTMLEDRAFDVVAWLVNTVSDEFARAGGIEFIGQPSSVLRDPFTHKPFIHFYVTRARNNAALKPCPMCGSEARLVWPTARDNGRVKCLNIGCGAEGGVGWTFADIERRWNTRASAIEARSDATGTGAAEGESAGPQDDAQGGPA
jgi:hypothetical protein